MKTLRFSITLLIGLFLFTQCGKGPEFGEPTSDFEISNFKYEKSIKWVYTYGGEENKRIYLIMSCDIKNASGQTLTSYQGMKTGKYMDGQGLLYAELILDNYNDLGDFKSLAGDVFLFDGKEGICSIFNEDRPWKDGITYKAFFVFEMGSLNRDPDFVNNVLGEASYSPRLNVKISGGFKDERDRYFANPIEPGINIDDLREQTQALADSESNFPDFEVHNYRKMTYEFVCHANGLNPNKDYEDVLCPGFGDDKF